MAISFHKMHGLGNDFVVLDLRHQAYPIDSKTAIQLADRNTGIGCDQVLVLRQANNGQQLASFEIWNSDGSLAEQCGNGVRCLGLYWDSFTSFTPTTSPKTPLLESITMPTFMAPFMVSYLLFCYTLMLSQPFLIN